MVKFYDWINDFFVYSFLQEFIARISIWDEHELQNLQQDYWNNEKNDAVITVPKYQVEVTEIDEFEGN